VSVDPVARGAAGGGVVASVPESTPAVGVGAQLCRMASSAARAMLGLILLGMVLLNVSNAIGRYFIGAVLVGTDELLVFAMVWLVMIGLILVTAQERNIALDFLLNHAGQRTRLGIATVNHAVVAVGCSYAAAQSWIFLQRLAAVGQVSMGLGIPMLIPHAALLIGLAGTAIVAALLAAGNVRQLIAIHRSDQKALR
jgi:TRAP-type transport system small permease protein